MKSEQETVYSTLIIVSLFAKKNSLEFIRYAFYLLNGIKYYE